LLTERYPAGGGGDQEAVGCDVDVYGAGGPREYRPRGKRNRRPVVGVHHSDGGLGLNREAERRECRAAGDVHTEVKADGVAGRDQNRIIQVEVERVGRRVGQRERLVAARRADDRDLTQYGVGSDGRAAGVFNGDLDAGEFDRCRLPGERVVDEVEHDRRHVVLATVDGDGRDVPEGCRNV
jgi:hypothetical protein